MTRRGRWLAWLALPILGTACCAQPQPAAPPDDRVAFEQLPGGADARRWLQEPVRLATAQGAGNALVLAVDAGAPGDRIGGMLSTPGATCLLLVARAAASVEDLDLFAYADDGSVLGTDQQPNRTPALLVCPPHPRRMYVVARIAAGHGIVAVAAQRVNPSDAERVARAVGISHPTATETTNSEAWPGLEERVLRRRRALGAAWRDVRRVAVPVEPRVPTRVSADIEPSRCLDVLAVPADGVAHLDMAVVGQDGRLLGRASGHGRDRALVVCSATRTPVTIELRPHVGEGLVALVLSRSSKGARRQLDGTTIVHDAAPSAPLSEIRTQHADRLARAGYGPPKLVAQGTLAVARRTSVPLELPAGCTRLDLLAGRPVQGVATWLWDDDGALVARDHAAGRSTLFACTTGGTLRLDAEALAVPGSFVVESRAEPGTSAVLSRHPLAASRLLGAMLDRGVIRRAAQVTAATVVHVAPTHLEYSELLVPVGRCVDLTLALGPGATGAEVRLVDTLTEAEFSLARGNTRASARACALERRTTLKVRAELRCELGSTDALIATRMLAPRE